MLEQLRAWLNGKREYYAGLVLLAEAGCAASVLAVLKKGPTPFSIAKLQGELLAICKQLKAKQNVESDYSDTVADKYSTTGTVIHSVISQEKETTPSTAHQGQTPANPELFESCRQEALTIYKTAMNDRAILFSQVNALGAQEVNLPHHIASRTMLALAVVRNFNEASRLFDRADYVKQHGRLPDGGVQEDASGLYNGLLDEQVFDTLSNLRKAYSKLKAKAQTPERIALMQQHKSNIDKLEARWRTLKEK